MPELPEVQTTVSGLQKTIVGLAILDVWSDLGVRNQSIPHFKETFKNLSFFEKFKKEIKGQKVVSVSRRAKNILIHLKNKRTILIHMKMTGHLLYGTYTYDKKKNMWHPAETEKNNALRDPFNKFIHAVFALSNKKHLRSFRYAQICAYYSS
jgi:formamidopyrimidine-DNA glycosylase